MSPMRTTRLDRIKIKFEAWREQRRTVRKYRKARLIDVPAEDRPVVRRAHIRRNNIRTILRAPLAVAKFVLKYGLIVLVVCLFLVPVLLLAGALTQFGWNSGASNLIEACGGTAHDVSLMTGVATVFAISSLGRIFAGGEIVKLSPDTKAKLAAIGRK